MIARKPHIGIVACSAEGAALCYRTICLEGSEVFGRHGHPDVSMHTHCLADYMMHVEKSDWSSVAELMASSAQKLQAVGADVLVCPDNTIHQAFELARQQVAIPWLHIADVVVGSAKQQGICRLGILGTKYLMEGPVYREACLRAGIESIIPNEDRRRTINAIIFDELVNGVITESSKRFFHYLIDDLKAAGCDGVVLGCTEIPLIVDPVQSSLPTFDSTRLLARAALTWAKERHNVEC